MLAGLARLAGIGTAELSALAATIAVPTLAGSVRLEQRAVGSVLGWTCQVALPHEHHHRNLTDIRRIIADSSMAPRAAALATATFETLAAAEGRVHGLPAEAVTFHEVGALDSILDICLSAILFDRLDPAGLVCGPLPLADGTIRCSHGLVPAPAPAILEMLDGVPVRGLPTAGETVTPTALALLKGLGARFGGWPSIIVGRTALVYGTRVLAGVANGAIFALGTPFDERAVGQ